jgi:hypothetical protein
MCCNSHLYYIYIYYIFNFYKICFLKFISTHKIVSGGCRRGAPAQNGITCRGGAELEVGRGSSGWWLDHFYVDRWRQSFCVLKIA